MGVPLVLLAIAGLLHSTLAVETCQWPDQVIASSLDQSYYFKCLAPGVSVQLKCPPGLYFPQGGESCISSLAAVKLPEPQIPQNLEPSPSGNAQKPNNLPTAPTPAHTAPTQNPIVGENSKNKPPGEVPSAPVKEEKPVVDKSPATIPPAAPAVKKGQKTTKRQRGTTPSPKNLSKRKTTTGSKSQKSASKTVVPKRRKVQN